MSYQSRNEIGLRPPEPGPGFLTRTQVDTIVFHWPGMHKPVRGVDNVCAALRGWQRMHMDTNGWSDIAYQVAVDQEGNRYHLRGLRTQSGANGSSEWNQRGCAVLLVLAIGEVPSPAMCRSVRRVVQDARTLYPAAMSLKGHGEVRPEPTACPGGPTMAAIGRGAFEPRTDTRGRWIDSALEALAKATGTGRRRVRIDSAIQELERINPL